MESPQTNAPTPARAPWIAFALVVATALALTLLFRATGPSDDDFIVQRYARNLLDGRGLVFDDGARVEGFTCPLWLFVLAGVMAVGGVAAAVGPWIGAAAVLASALIALARAPFAGRAPAVAAAFAIAASAALAHHAALGLGTTLAGFLVLAWYVATERAERVGGSHVLAGVFLGLATLLRPETAGFALPWLVLLPRERRLGALVAFAMWSGAWLVFRLAYYGEWLPMTYYAKKLPLADDLGYGFDYLARATLDTGFVVLLALAAFARATGRALRAHSATAALVGAGVTTAIVTWAGGDYLPLARFLVPALPVVLVLACDALHAMLPVARVPALAAVALVGAWPCVNLDQYRGTHAFYEERWIAIGEMLRARFPADTRVATAPIGAIGFHSRLPIVDLLGLTNSAIRNAKPDLAITMKGHHRYDADWVLAQRPDLLVLGNGVVLPGERTLRVSAWEESLVRHPRFAAEYEPLVLPVPGSYDLFAFRRKAWSGPR